MTPLLSVVVPYLNVADYIGDCLESLSRQTLTDLEVILVDDGSTDGSTEIVQATIERDPRFRRITQSGRGPGPARNTGIAHASGEYLAFADADDLVPWHAYETMVHSLRTTGSSFAASGARRFNLSTGVWPSWSHQQVFGQRALATHIFERPSLGLDRMVWNKVYRRDFYDTAALSFPPILYEDYPVVLRGHLEALTVDVLPEPLYHWRQRESGDSITQRVFQLANLRDRVTSAEMVVDTVRQTPRRVRSVVHSHLADIDLVALLQSFGTVQPDEIAPLLSLGERLVGLLDPEVLARRPALDRLQLAAMGSADVDLLHDLARFRSRGGEPAARVRRRPAAPWILEADYPGRGRRDLDPELFHVGRDALALQTTVTHVRWSDRTVQVQGTAGIARLDTHPGDELTVTLLCGSTLRPVPLIEVSPTQGDDGVQHLRFTAELQLDDLRDVPWIAWPLRFHATYRHRRWVRRGVLRGLQAGSPEWATGTWLTPAVWVRAGRGPGGGLTLHRLTRPTIVDSMTTRDGVFVLSGLIPDRCSTAWLQVPRRAPLPPSRLPLALTSGEGHTRFDVQVPPSFLLRNETPHDPYTRRTRWPLQLATESRTSALVWVGGRDPVTLAEGGQTVSLQTTVGQQLEAVHQPACVQAVAVELSADAVVVRGLWFPPASPIHVRWRRFLAATDEPVDVETQLDHDELGWTAVVDSTELVTGLEQSHDGSPVIARWVLTAMTDQGTAAVECTGAAGMALPMESELGVHSLRVTMVRETLHVEVRHHA